MRIANKRRWSLAAAGIVLCGACVLAAGPVADMALDKFPLARMLRRRVQRMRELRRKLALTGQQQAQLLALVQEHRKEIKACARDLVRKRRALREAVLAGTANETTIKLAAAELGRSIGEAAVLAATLRERAETVLTPGQAEKIRDAIAANDKDVDRWLDEMLEQR